MGTGASFASNDPSTATDKVEALIRLINTATDTNEKHARFAVTVQDASYYRSSPVIYSDATAKMTLDMSAAPGVTRSAVLGYWGRKLEAGSFKTIWTDKGNFRGMDYTNYKVDARFPVVRDDGSAGSLGVSSAHLYNVGDWVFYLLVGAVGTGVSMYSTQNGNPRLVTSYKPSFANTMQGFRLNGAAMNFNLNGTHVRDRIALWAPATLPDFGDEAMWQNLVDRRGRMKNPALANAIFGTPLFDERGNAAAVNAGTQYGSLGKMTITNSKSAQDYQE